MLLLVFKNKLNSKFPTALALLAVLILLFPNSKVLASQNKINDTPLKFKRLSLAEGLSQSYVYDITQDNNGFIWIATQDGLNRYDGKNFVYYRHDSINKHSIADNFIRKLFIDNNNVLWVGTNQGLSRYNELLDNFDNFFHQANDGHSLKDNQIWDIYQDKKNDILISSKEGLHKFDSKSNNFSRIRIRGFDNALKKIKTIFQDNKGNYWLGSDDQGILLSNNTLSFAVPLRKQNKWSLRLGANALYDLKLIDNQYWLATDNGLYIVSQDYKIIKHYSDSSADISAHILSNKVRSIAQLDDSTVWLGTANGLNSINLLSDKVSAYQSAQHKNSLSFDVILKVFKDKANKMWLGTNGGGVNTFNPLQLVITHGLFNYDGAGQALAAFAETSDRTVWFATAKGQLNKIDQTDKINPVAIKNGQAISHLLADKKNNLWLKTLSSTPSEASKLYYYQTATGKLTEHAQWPKKSAQTLKSKLILLDEQLWFINKQAKLVKFNLKTKLFSYLDNEAELSFSTVTSDDKGKLWLATPQGKF